MLRYSFGMFEEAAAIEDAVNKTLDDGVRTRDLQGTASTREIGDKIRENLAVLLNSKAQLVVDDDGRTGV
jgi:3-isopropylmalate dehydrogenase